MFVSVLRVPASSPSFSFPLVLICGRFEFSRFGHQAGRPLTPSAPDPL